MSVAVEVSPASKPKSYTRDLVILTSLFFAWGFLTSLNGILSPYLRAVFSMSAAQATLAAFAFRGAYLLVSVPAGSLVQRVGYRRGIVVGLVIAALGCVLFLPAAGLRSFDFFLTALFILASGITILQVSANPYVTLLGAPESAPTRLTLTQAFNSLGTTLAPLFGTMVIMAGATKGADELAKLTPAELDSYQTAAGSAVQMPYLGLAAALAIVAVVFFFVDLPTVEVEQADTSDRKTSAWQHRHLVLGAVAIFTYVGGEVAVGSSIVRFISDRDIGGMTVLVASQYLAYYWGGAMIGRFIGAAVMRRVRPHVVLAFNAAAAGLLVLVTILGSGKLAILAVLLVGLFNSVMFPTIFALSLRGLGRHTAQGSGILCMATVGGAVIPALQGLLADAVGVQASFIVPMFCYVYIGGYAMWGAGLKSGARTVSSYAVVLALTVTMAAVSISSLQRTSEQIDHVTLTRLPVTRLSGELIDAASDAQRVVLLLALEGASAARRAQLETELRSAWRRLDAASVAWRELTPDASETIAHDAAASAVDTWRRESEALLRLLEPGASAQGTPRLEAMLGAYGAATVPLRELSHVSLERSRQEERRAQSLGHLATVTDLLL